MNSVRLQLVYAWRRHLLGYRLLRDRDRVTVGPAKKVTFSAPALPGQPKRFLLIAPKKHGGFELRVAPGMTGQLHLRTGIRSVEDVLAEPAPKRFLRGDRGVRQVDVMPGDAGVVYLDPSSDLKVQWSFVDPPELVERKTRRDPIFTRIATSTAVGIALAVAALMILRPADQSDDISITPERLTAVVAPKAFSPKIKEDVEKQKEGAKKKKEKEAAMSKRMKGDEGRLGRKDADKPETTLPKGREDVLREKVQKTGLLAALGNAKASGSGLGRLFTESDAEMDQAVTGLVGAQVAVGKGSGGVGVAGTGLGGGGTGFGRIQGSGDVDVGAGRGRGRKGPGLGSGKEKEVSVGMSTGDADADGGLTREQVQRVVKAHQAAIRYCYEKELQRKPGLEGQVTLYWVVRPNGTVDRAKIDKTTLENRDAESCMERQVKAWQFPKSTANTVVRFPFFFKGGGR